MTRTVTTARIFNNASSVPPLYLNLSQTAPVYRVALTAGQLALVGAGGAGGYTYSATGVPSGLTLNTATGKFSGTAATIGHYTITATVTDSATNTFTTTFTLEVLTRLIGTAVTPTAMEQSLAYSYQFAVSGATGAVTWSIGSGSLPAGATLSSGGVLSGTATTYGTFAFTIRASDAGTGDTADFPFPAFVVAQAFSGGNFWTQASSMVSARDSHTATLLASGNALVTGGYDGTSAIATCEVYNPATNVWSSASALATARYYHTASLLASNKVIVAGGANGSSYFTSCELYDPVANTWSAAGSLTAARNGHTAIVLASGKVLVAGGYNGTSYLTSCELYDPVANTWSAAGSMTTARAAHSATLLGSGKVLVAGGLNGSGATATCEIYDPVANTWSSAGSLSAARYNHAASNLSGGKVLATGGITSAFISSCELYDPGTNTWSSAASMNYARASHTASVLLSGKVLVAGGSGDGYLASCEIYDPAVGIWSAAASMLSERASHAAVIFSGGKVLATGGISGATSVYLATAETYSPSALSDLFATVGTYVSTNVCNGVVTGGVAPYTASFSGWTGGVPPPGLTFNGDGSVTGTPTATISESVTVTYTDALGATATATLGIVVAGSRLQPQKSASNVGPQGATVINFEFPSSGTPSVTNDGATMTVTIPTVAGAQGAQGAQGSQGPQGAQGATGPSVWGGITGTLSSQTDLQTALNAKANDSAVVHLTGNETIAGTKTFTGTPTASATNPTFLLASTGGQSWAISCISANGRLRFFDATNVVEVASLSNDTNGGNFTVEGSAKATSHGTPTNALGTVGATATADFTKGTNTATGTSATNCTLTFTAPSVANTFCYLEFTQPASGTAVSLTFPATVKVSNGVAIPQPNQTLGAVTPYVFWWDGSTYWLMAPTAGALIKRTLLTSSSGTFTTQAGTHTIRIRGIGGGASSGGCAGSIGSRVAATGGGGGGTPADRVIGVSPSTGYSYTCGAAGAAPAAGNNSGNNGTASTFIVGATTITAPGGIGSNGASAWGTLGHGPGGAGGTAATNDDFGATGETGGDGWAFSIFDGNAGATMDARGGVGGASIFGVRAPSSSAAGSTQYGGGGGGSTVTANVNVAGKAGCAGCWIVEEYS